jgi:hypothetical protein
MGSGEGSQEYGWGLYFSSTTVVAEHLRVERSRQQTAARP